MPSSADQTKGESVPVASGAHAARPLHESWLKEITQIPTAAGREQGVIEWIRKWVGDRPQLRLITDQAGNLVVEPKKPWGKSGTGGGAGGGAAGNAPIFITAHLDHPAFVVERIVGPATVELSFRGGVMDAYFEAARIVIDAANTKDGSVHRIGATLIGESAGASNPFGKLYLAELDAATPTPNSDGIAVAHHADQMLAHSPSDLVGVGDIATWALPAAEIDADGILHTAACDDLAALAAAISAYDMLLALAERGEQTEDVRLLFTRAEEIGFIGAIAACRLGTMPKDARVIALENSRAFPESPIGGGPIVRVGDRMSIFTPQLTAACAKRAEEINAAPASPTATQRNADVKGSGGRWQRKLMAGGACEATVFCAYGYAATCLCLPLGNYHNMSNLAAVQDGTYDTQKLGPPRVGREFIAVSDFHGLVDLLVAIGQRLPSTDPVVPRLENLYTSKSAVLGPEANGQVATKAGGSDTEKFAPPPHRPA